MQVHSFYRENNLKSATVHCVCFKWKATTTSWQSLTLS